MDQEPDVIRRQIDQTRSSLTEKLETLECQVRGTVESAKASVDETIENVKSTVHETVATVKRTFDINYQVANHPWAMFGGSVLAGFLAGSFVPTTGRGRAIRRDPGPVDDYEARQTVSRRDGAGEAPQLQTANGAPRNVGFMSKLLDQFSDEIDKLKGVAVGATMGVVRDVVKRQMPQFAEHIDEVMNSATVKLGGEPIRRPLVGGAESTWSDTDVGVRSRFSRQ
jgi:hypothetical protein